MSDFNQEPEVGADYLSSKEASDISGYTTAYLAKLARDGSVLSRRNGYEWLIERGSLEKFARAQGEQEEKRREALREARKSEYLESNHFISSKEASALSGYTPAYLAKLAREGLVVSKRDGREWLIEKPSLENFTLAKEAEDAARREALRQTRAAEYGERNGFVRTPASSGFFRTLANIAVGGATVSAITLALVIGYSLLFSPSGMPTAANTANVIGSGVNFYHSLVDAIASLFPQTVIVEAPVFVPGKPAASAAVAQVVQRVGTTTVTNVYNQYVTQNGVSPQALTDAVQILGNKFTSQIATITSSTQGNTQSIQLMNAPNNTYQSVSISGSRINGGSIYGTSANLTTLEVTGDTNLNGALSIGGALSLSGTLASSGSISAPYFTATSAATASTFPYASTTALTIAGTNGLTLLNTLNGPLQANNGAVSATTSVGIVYGGTGTTSAPIGQLLYGGASAFQSVATTSPLLGLGLSYSGTLGALVGGISGSLTVATSSLYTGTMGQFPYFSGTNTITGTSDIFDSSGKIGIGTTSPFSALSVSTAVQQSATLPLFTVASTTNTTLLTVLGNGSVGIGIANPTVKLHVAGTVVAGELAALTLNNQDISANASTRLRIVNSTTPDAVGVNGAIDLTSIRLADGSANLNVLASFGGGTTPISRFTLVGANGNFGVGTSTPFARFDVASSSASASNFGQFALTDSNAGTNLKHWLFSSEGGNFYLGTTTDAYATSSPAFSIINASGFAGVSSSSPGSIFAIGNANGINFTFATSTFSTGSGLNLTGGCYAIGGNCLSHSTLAGIVPIANGGTATTTFASNGILYYDSGNTRVTNSSIFNYTNGNIGIGTTSPAHKIDAVAGADTWAGSFQGAATTGNKVLLGTYTGVAAIGANNASENAWANLTINPGGGNVGIGTTSPQTTLHVVGGTLTNNQETTYPIWASSNVNSRKALILGYDTTNDIGVINAVQESVAWKNIALQTNGGNVGIGTSTPNQKLDVAVSGNVPAIRLENSSSQGLVGLLGIAGGTNSLITGDAGGDLDIYASTGKINFSTNNGTTNYMTISGAGNVGIGTTTPFTKLDVNGALSIEANNMLRFYTDTDGNYSFIKDPGTGNVPTLGFYVTNNNPDMFIASTGNVGIGNNLTSPNARLDVESTVRGNPASSGSATDGVMRVGYSSSAVLDVGQTNVPAVNAMWMQARNAGDYSSNYNLLLQPNGGNVGIGTTSPAYSLDVNGNSHVYGPSGNTLTLEKANHVPALSFLGTVPGQTLIEGGDNFNFYTNSVSRIYITNAGNVGLGDTGPGTKLTVATTSPGASGISTARKNAAAYFESLSGSSVGLAVGDTSGGYPYLQGMYADDATTRDIMLNPYGGNVGIGTVSPSVRLHVVDAAGANGTIDFGTADHPGSLLYDNGGNTTVTLESYFDSAAAAINFKLRAGGTPVTAMTILGGGNVGIGTTTPVNALSVQSGAGNALAYPIRWGRSDGAVYGLLGQDSSTDNTLLAGSGSNQNFSLITNSVRRLTIDTSGNVGVGTTGNTVYKLAVDSGTSGTTYNDIGIGGNGGSSNNEEHTISSYYSNTVAAHKIGSIIFHYDTTNNGSIRFGNIYGVSGDSSSVAMTINGNGNVGIGTTTPQRALEVFTSSVGNVLVRAFSTGANSSGGGGFVGAYNDSGSANASGDRLGGFIIGGAKDAAHTIANTVGLVGWANEAWNSGASGTDLGFETTAAGGTSRTEKLRITGSGNVGIGTTTPTAQLEIGNAAARLRMGGYNTGAGDAQIQFTDFTNGIYDYNRTLPEMQRSWGSTTGDFIQLSNANSTNLSSLYLSQLLGMEYRYNNTQLFTVKTNGNVGIGTTTPNKSLVVNNAGTSLMSFERGNTSIAAVDTSNNDFNLVPNGANNIRMGTFGSAALNILSGGNIGIGTTSPSFLLGVGNNTVSGTVAQFENSTGSCYINPNNSFTGCTSDQRLKTNVTTLAPELSTVMQLNPVSFTWISDPTNAEHQGFIAQQVQALYPDLVMQGPDGYLALNYAGLTPHLTSAIQELNIKLESIATTTPTEALDVNSFVGRFIASLLVRINAWLADAGNGINKFFAKAVYTNTLCIKKSDGTDVCVTGDQLASLLAGQTASASTTPQSGENGGTASSTPPDTTAPVITLMGANPATIAVGSTYVDLGATVTDNVDQNLGYKVSMDGGALMDPSGINLDTSTSTTHTILYSATDTAGNTGTAQRTVTVE